MADSNQETKWRDELEGSSQKSWTRIRTIESLDQSQKSESSGSYPRYRWNVLDTFFHLRGSGIISVQDCKQQRSDC
jgi:hypothetical protein